jgi:hypothetical protein
VPFFEGGRKVEKFLGNRKVLITLNVIDFAFIAFNIIWFYLGHQGWQQTMIYGTMFILLLGLNFMDLEKIKKGDRR